MMEEPTMITVLAQFGIGAGLAAVVVPPWIVFAGWVQRRFPK